MKTTFSAMALVATALLLSPNFASAVQYNILDLGISLDRAESFRIFQERILNNYDAMVDSDNFVLMDGTVRVNKLQKLMRQIVGERISLQQFAPKKR